MEYDNAYDYLFGFGSIINTNTHASWMADGSQALPGQRANIRACFGYRRGWNFRSNTGFTALGIAKDNAGDGTVINGVLFRIPHSMLSSFDRREVGYDRVEMNLEHLELLPGPDSAGGLEVDTLKIADGAKLWVYVPKQSFCAEANEDHPILQSYVDTVIQGCLQWGGEEMAEQFVVTTYCWSPYFLNDTPASRRPWLFRKEYNTIDSILSKHPATHYEDRRHPEEFASAFLINMMRGTWSIPQRNATFTGRDLELSQIHARLIAQKAGQNHHTGVAKVEITGMGGVGKTQLCTEYCYRNFPSYYGLVIWLSAQGAERIVACYRQLLADTTGVDARDKDTEEVISEVKARLFRSKVPWLLVFDNLEDRSLLQKFVPHGGSCGHLLVTTRSLGADDNDQSTMILGCFSPSESIQLLCRSANISGEIHVKAAHHLAGQLGHLPLALSMAAAYMLRCDVDCSEYLARYADSERNGALLGHQVVESSLALSLNAIKRESQLAWEVLRLLCWLGPDQITKALVRTLLRAKHVHSIEEANTMSQAKASSEAEALARKAAADAIRGISRTVLIGGLAMLTTFVLERRTKGSNRLAAARIAAKSMVTVCMAATYLLTCRAKSLDNALPLAPKVSQIVLTADSAKVPFDEFEQTDSIWKIVKSFSLLVVKESKGSMHRLLAQALRKSQTEAEGRVSLKICVHAIKQAWRFKPDQIESWQESAYILEHLKAVVAYSCLHPDGLQLDCAILSREAGVFSAMALNRFDDAKDSLDQSLEILNRIDNGSQSHSRARAAVLYELGRVLRYQGSFRNSEEALSKALLIRSALVSTDFDERHGVAAILHELGVLEVKKHNLQAAADFLERALDLRRILDVGSAGEVVEADCAATLHQLAAVHLARKPPSLAEAEALLQEALGLRMQIGQRAATLKQLARVAIRRGEFDSADRSLSQALELYVELYGEAALHVNVAAVKFQQGVLAFQREQFGQAWDLYSECLRARRYVYSYIQGVHIDVSSVLHELGRVAFAEQDIIKAQEMLLSEKEVLDQLCESHTHDQRMLQARLTNLTWLCKCAKELGDDKEARRLAAERNSLKRHDKPVQASDLQLSQEPRTLNLQHEALLCRSVARQDALSGMGSIDADRTQLRTALDRLSRQIQHSEPHLLRTAAIKFHTLVTDSLNQSTTVARGSILQACDMLRDVLREHGVQVHDCTRAETDH